jgi:two-component system chemotaxis response regulator CheB
VRGAARARLDAGLLVPTRDILVLGASAGGVEALTQVVRGLPPGLPAAVFVVLHLPAGSTSMLPSVLARASALTAVHATDGAPIVPGAIYVAPPGRHLLLTPQQMQLNDGPLENGHRPAIDVLFRSAARAHRERVVGVVLSGTGDDGTAGLQLIKAFGGLAAVQDPRDAAFRDMPGNALREVAVDAVAPASELPSLLVHAVREGLPARVAASPRAAIEQAAEAVRVELDKREQEQGERPNTPSVLSCPDCGGVLWELQEGNLTRYRCHVGHAYSPSSLDVRQTQALETAMWTAVRMFRERAMNARRNASRARAQSMEFLVANLERRAEDAERCATLIEDLLSQDHVGGSGTAGASEDG